MTVVFQDTYQLLSPKQQKIWNVIQHFCKTYRNAFPSLSKIAELAGCSIRTVCTAINKFKKFGWLESTKRCFRSCLYYIKEQLLYINTKDKRNFLKPTNNYHDGGGGGTESSSCEELHDKLQHIQCIPKGIKTLSDSIPKKEKKYYRPNRHIPHFLGINAITLEDQQKLANQFSERDLYEALQESKSFWRNVAKIKNMPAWITAKCKQYIKKREDKIEKEKNQ